MPTPTSEDRVFKRVAEMVDEMLEDNALGVYEVEMPTRTLTRIRQGCRNITLRTLVRTCEVLGYELVLNARKRS